MFSRGYSVLKKLFLLSLLVCAVAANASNYAQGKTYCRAPGCSGVATGNDAEIDLYCLENGKEVLVTAIAKDIKIDFVDVYDQPLGNSDIYKMRAEKVKHYIVEGTFNDICDDLFTFCDKNNIERPYCKGLRMLFYIQEPLASLSNIEYRDHSRPY